MSEFQSLSPRSNYLRAFFLKSVAAIADGSGGYNSGGGIFGVKYTQEHAHGRFVASSWSVGLYVYLLFLFS